MRNWTCFRGTRTAAVALLATLALTGCGTQATDAQATTSATSLWSMRADYVGNNSRVVALVREVFPASDFSYTLSLDTTARPFAVTVRIDRIAKPIRYVDFSGQATLLLGLIANADVVNVTSSESYYSLTAAGATKSLGYDVKELGRSQARLEAYLRAQGAD